MPETEQVTNIPICKTQICKRPLTYLKEAKCWRCLVCNPIPKDKPKQEKKKKFLDVKVTEEQVEKMIQSSLTGRTLMTEDKIREIVQDELMNWHIQKPPATRDEIAEAVAVGGQAFIVDAHEETWRQKAKRMGISIMKEPKGTGMRKKSEVLLDIERKEQDEKARQNSSEGGSEEMVAEPDGETE